MQKAKLKTISKWADLKGKSLTYLNLRQNPDLRLDLAGLRGGLRDRPLKNWAAVRGEIYAYLEMENLSDRLKIYI